jgi:hypothetical protein
MLLILKTEVIRFERLERLLRLNNWNGAKRLNTSTYWAGYWNDWNTFANFNDWHQWNILSDRLP